MPKLTPVDLKVGMKLSKPIIGPNGMVMMAEGAELTERWIERIREMNIEGVYVTGTTEQRTPKDEALQQLEDRFKHVTDKPYMGIIKRAVREHIEGLYG